MGRATRSNSSIVLTSTFLRQVWFPSVIASTPPSKISRSVSGVAPRPPAEFSPLATTMSTAISARSSGTSFLMQILPGRPTTSPIKRMRMKFFEGLPAASPQYAARPPDLPNPAPLCRPLQLTSATFHTRTRTAPKRPHWVAQASLPAASARLHLLRTKATLRKSLNPTAASSSSASSKLRRYGQFLSSMDESNSYSHSYPIEQRKPVPASTAAPDSGYGGHPAHHRTATPDSLRAM